MADPDVSRPSYHFTPPSAWMNDPNGLVWDGEYHLFYQHHPHSLVWGPMHWGHAVSSDLVHWEHLPVALEPDENGTIFSGSAVWDRANTSGLVPGGGLVAVFSFDSQAQGVAASTDRGRTWTKYSQNPVIPSPGKDFRDPKVFEDAQGWTAVLAAGDHVEFFRSSNLRDWILVGQWSAPLGPGVWECPDLFPLGDWWVLLLSVTEGAPAGGSGTLYWLGTWDGQSFHPETGPHWLDWGPDNYARVTWNHAPDGRRLLVGWMSNWTYARDVPATDWRGTMTVPRELFLAGPGPRLAQRPAEELKRLRGAPSALPNGPIPPAADLEMVLEGGRNPVVVTWSRPGGQLVLTWNPVRGDLVLDRGPGSPARWTTRFRAPLVPAGPRLVLRVLLDVSSVEVFAQGGLTVLTAQLEGPSGPWSCTVEGAAFQGTAWPLG